MPEVDLSVIGKKNDPVTVEYTWKDVVLYALSVGATEKEQSLVYENVSGGLKVLPSYSVILAGRAFPNVGNVDWPLFLHGLCTYGYAVRAVIQGGLGGDTDRLIGFDARFSSPVCPGDTLTTEGWKADGGYVVRVNGSSGPVITNAFAAIE